MIVLKNDNEENAIISMKIIMDIIKSYRSDIEKFKDIVIDPFLLFVCQLYEDLKNLLEKFESFKTFKEETLYFEGKKILFSSQKSFKVLIECPLVVVRKKNNFRF
jgi:hypothetical protein